jgi:glycosyltransferase involved in cell wall biosynthesis
MKTGILIVNRNNLKYTIDLINCLRNQTYSDFEITVVDNGSSEKNTESTLKSIQSQCKINLEFTGNNIPLNHLWNQFFLKNDYDLYSYLNNDIIIPKNYYSDTIEVFKRENNVGCVAHSTNHPNYQKVSSPVEYVKFSDKYRQGWDFTITKSAYSLIPKSLQFFCGDDFIFEKLYSKGMEFAIITSSPIIHYQGMTPRISGISNSDISEYKKLGFPHGRLDVCFEYSNFKPTFNKIIE